MWVSFWEVELGFLYLALGRVVVYLIVRGSCRKGFCCWRYRSLGGFVGKVSVFCRGEWGWRRLWCFGWWRWRWYWRISIFLVFDFLLLRFGCRGGLVCFYYLGWFCLAWFLGKIFRVYWRGWWWCGSKCVVFCDRLEARGFRLIFRLLLYFEDGEE